MRKIIHHLRGQPEETRRHILHFLIFISAIILLVLWVYSLKSSLSNEDTKVKMKQDIAPFSVLKDNIVDGYKSTTNTDSSVEQ